MTHDVLLLDLTLLVCLFVHVELIMLSLNFFFLSQTADLSLVFKDSSPTTPLIFVLSVGTDPAADLYKFAEEMRFSKKLSAISLGQGQVFQSICSVHHCCACLDFYTKNWIHPSGVHTRRDVFSFLCGRPGDPGGGDETNEKNTGLQVNLWLSLPFQGPRAEAMMRSAMERGKWVFFQNCHLAPSWMPALERLVENIDPDKVSGRVWWCK